MKGEEEGGNKNNYTNVSLRLCINIHQYIDAQSHLLHTLPLSLSLPLSHSLSHTHTHTHTQTMKGRGDGVTKIITQMFLSDSA